jgi:hypothetical protein
MADTEPMMIDCGTHGQRVSAVVCRHMLQTEPSPSGFVENSDDVNDLQAWCYLCEEKFEQEGGMTDNFKEFNGMTIVCIVCYNDSKLRHAIPAAQ